MAAFIDSTCMTWIIVVGACYFILMFLQGLGLRLDRVFGFILNRPKKITLRAKDIWQSQYKKRKKLAADMLRMSDLRVKGLVLIGDGQVAPVKITRVTGLITHPECYELFVRFSFLSFSKWALIPPELLDGTNEIVWRVRARSLRPDGIHYIPVFSLDDKDKELQLYARIRRWKDLTLERELIDILAELKVHSAVTGAQVEPLDYELVARREGGATYHFPDPGQGQEETVTQEGNE